MKRLITFIGVMQLICTISIAQEQLGIRTSNYGGVNSLLLNPANSLTLPFAWDANLIEFGQFFENNYGFIEDFRLLDMLQNPSGVELRPLLKEDNQSPAPGSIVMDFYNGNEKKQGNLATQFVGPSLMLRLGELSSLAFFTRARVALHARDVPPSLGYYEYNYQPFEEALLVESFNISVLSWSEIGFNFAYQTYTDYGEASFGVSLKALQGYEALYLRNNSDFELTQLRNNRLQGTAVDFSYGFASSGLDSGDTWQLQRHGAGLGLDLGTVFTFGDEDEGAYRLKLGASLLDLGFIRFTRAAQQHAIRTSDLEEVILDDYHNISGAEDLDSILQIFSRQLLNDPSASLQANSFTMWLPVGISVQADLQVLPSLFVNATIVQGVPLGKTAVRRTSVAALTPRMESRWFELAVPVSLLNWRQVRTGVAARVAFFWFGTEDFTSIFQKSNFDSTDFYVAIKINPFSFGKKDKDLRGGWSGRKTTRLRAKGNGDVKCPKF